MAVADILVSFLLLMMIYTILAFGLNVKFGHAGLLDFGHVAFFLVGAYTAALFVMPPNDPTDFTDYVIGLGSVPLVGNWVVGIVVATLLAGVLGGLVALPTIRLREDYLAITLLGVSVMFQRIIQSETWLANGPDALRGYSRPMQSAFPLDFTSLLDAVAVGFAVFVIWVILVVALAGQRERRPSGVASTVLAVATFGTGYALPLSESRVTHALLSAAIAGLLSFGLLYAFGEILAVGVAVSLLGWVVAGIELAQRFGSERRRTLAAGVLLGSGAIVALLPLVVVDSLALKTGGTLGLLVALAYSYGYGVANVDWVSDAKLTLVSIAVSWCFFLWYFLSPIREPVAAGDVAGAASTLFTNAVWLLKFDSVAGVDYRIALVGGVTAGFDYSRFLLAVLILVVIGTYYLLELAVNSPFGRTLRAIRNDEEVVESLGKDPFVYKVQSMVIGSALAGLAGALWAIYSQGLTFASGDPEITFITLLIVFLGGLASNKGMVLGAAIYWAFQQMTTQIADFFPTAMRTNILAFRLVVIGLLFLVVLYYMPDGLMGRNRGTDGGSRR